MADNGAVTVDPGPVPEPHPPAGSSPDAPFAYPTQQASDPATWPRPDPGTQWAAPQALPERQGQNRRLRVLTGLVVVEGIAIVALALALIGANSSSTTSQPLGSAVAPSGTFTQTTGHVVYSSDFGPNDHWLTGTLNENTVASLSSGRYLIQAWTQIHHPLTTPYSVPHPGISVEAQATDYPLANVSIGVGCQSGSGVQPPLVYQLAVYPSGQWYLEAARISGAVETLTSGSTYPLTRTATAELSCVITKNSSAQEVTQLVAFVNGFRVGSIGDQVDQPVGGYIPILLVGSYGPTIHVAFESMAVRTINP